MSGSASSTTKKLRLGYAGLIGAPKTAFDTSGFVLYTVEKRAEIAWENWLQPVWLVTLGHTTVCVAAPQYAERARKVFGSGGWQSLLCPGLLKEAQNCFGLAGWQSLEILYYSSQAIALDGILHPVIKLRKGHIQFESYSRAFSGNTYVILDQDQQIVAWAGIKDHGPINEIAVGTGEGYRRQGMGKAVVGNAVADILARKRVPVYVPDELTNQASYALAYSCGFQKAGEMLLWEVQA